MLNVCSLKTGVGVTIHNYLLRQIIILVSNSIQIVSIYLEYEPYHFKAILTFWNRLNLSKLFSYAENLKFCYSLGRANYQALSRFTGGEILFYFRIMLPNKQWSLFTVFVSLMKNYCWKVSLVFEYLMIAVKTTVIFHHFSVHKCWLLSTLNFALHPWRHS